VGGLEGRKLAAELKSQIGGGRRSLGRLTNGQPPVGRRRAASARWPLVAARWPVAQLSVWLQPVGGP